MLRLENLSKEFRGLKAVQGVSFEIEEGKITGLIGPNGAGKTTLFNMISGVYEPTNGRVFYRGHDITGLKPYERSKMGIARTFQIMKPLPNMSVVDNVVAGSLFGMQNITSVSKARKHAKEILEFTGLNKKSEHLAKELGTPDRKRLELARALATKPSLLLLDEVMAGLTPKEIEDSVELIKKINKSGVTVLLIEHVMKAVANLCEKIVVLHHGEKIFEGNTELALNDKMVIEIYLGKDEDNA